MVYPLKDERAVELGADMLGETIIFSVAIITVYFEYNRQKRNEEKKEQQREDKLVTLEGTVRDMELKIDEQSAQIRNLTRNLWAQNSTPKAAVNHLNESEVNVTDTPKKAVNHLDECNDNEVVDTPKKAVNDLIECDENESE